MPEKNRWKQRFDSYSKALFQFKSALQQKNFSLFGKGWCAICPGSDSFDGKGIDLYVER